MTLNKISSKNKKLLRDMLTHRSREERLDFLEKIVRDYGSKSLSEEIQNYLVKHKIFKNSDFSCYNE